MRQLAGLLHRFLNGQAGISLVENLVAVSIIAAIGVVFMTSLDAAHSNVKILDEQIQGETLARSQLEIIKNSAYDVTGNYAVTVELPPQYTMDIIVQTPQCIGTADNCTTLDDLMEETVTTIQEITVIVYHGGLPVITVGCYKVDS